MVVSLAALDAAASTPKPQAEYPIPPAARPVGPINIDVGRQLFVDDYLIADTTLVRTSHHAKIHPDDLTKVVGVDGRILRHHSARVSQLEATFGTAQAWGQPVDL